MKLRWVTLTWTAWLLVLFGGSLVAGALVFVIKGDDGAYAFIIIGVPLGLVGGVLLALRRTTEPGPVTRRANIAANLLFIGFSLILTMLTAVIEQGRSLWLLLVPFVFLGLGLYVLRRQRG
jgi:hypothetical protein